MSGSVGQGGGAETPRTLKVRSDFNVLMVKTALVAAVLASLISLPMPDASLPERLFRAAALVSVGGGILALRSGLVADEHGVRVQHVVTKRLITWENLADVEFEQVEAKDLKGFHRLLLVTREGAKIDSEGNWRPLEPGGELFTLRQTLLAMRDHYVPLR